jgi:hypothetical protein
MVARSRIKMNRQQTKFRFSILHGLLGQAIILFVLPVRNILPLTWLFILLINVVFVVILWWLLIKRPM